MLNKAIAIAIAAKEHDGQTDKGDEPYILHPLRVLMNCEGEAAKTCAVLHDAIKVTNITLEDLRSQALTMRLSCAGLFEKARGRFQW